jgi:hypothetical protein
MTHENGLPKSKNKNKNEFNVEEKSTAFRKSSLLSAFQPMPKTVKVPISHHLRTPAKAVEKEQKFKFIKRGSD